MKYLLYIDILGFSNMVENDDPRIDFLYETINDLNVHKHHAFKTIIFSDTILAYSDFECDTSEKHSYASMFAIEFTQDLFYRITKKNLFFRAVIDCGEFTHKKLSNCEKFFGKTLVKCHNLEKTINCIGTFITTEASKYQSIFPTHSFSKNLNFVYFQKNYYAFSEEYNHPDMKKWSMLNSLDGPNWIAQETYLFKIIHKQSRKNIEPKIREKFINYLNFYRMKYTWPLSNWEENGFGMSNIIPSNQWIKVYRKIIKENY